MIPEMVSRLVMSFHWAKFTILHMFIGLSNLTNVMFSYWVMFYDQASFTLGDG